MINVFSYIYETLLPRYCYSCGKILINGENVICLECYLDLELKIYSFSRKNHSNEKYSYDNTEHEISLFQYSNKETISKLIPKFKYNENIILGKYLINSFIEELDKIEWFNEIDMIIPLPLHWYKKIKRGFNQSEIISDIIGKHFNIPVKKNVIIRKKYTKSQAMTPSKTKRLIEESNYNKSKVFKVKKPNILENKHILIIDDIITTGYTINNCICSTKNIKGLKISLFFLASTKEKLDLDSSKLNYSIEEPKYNKEIIP